ncbi:MAG: ABC transporter ATP-binding protein [Candidatus Nanosyncoccus sp.]
MISLEKVSKIYKTSEVEYRALDKINLEINQGEFVVILGPSGAGKSTLLNLLGGMDRPTGGKIIVNQVDISKFTDRQLTKFRAEQIGFVFQSYNILPSLTVEENVSIMRDIVKLKQNPIEVLKSVGLGRHLNKFPSELSGGEQQRVSIARAVVKKPAILLCDEPTGALDSDTGVQILKLLKAQTDKDTTVIIVTHNALIAEIADRVIHLKNGQIETNRKNSHKKQIDEVEW